MGKTSSSAKKKRSKNSSRARIKKRSKSRTRRNYNLKKLRHRDDSDSYSSDSDDSTSSVSVSSSSSDEDYRRKRSRSRTQKDVKVSKKRARRRSSSSASTEDSFHVKKQKGSKKNDDFHVSKKSREKKNKKSKRDVRVSSTSGGLLSCSTRWGGSTSSDEREVKKNKGSYERKDRDRRLKKVKNESKRRISRTRSRSCSSCSRSSDYRSEDKLIGEANSRRLRSVITIARDEKEGNLIYNDEHKEEMVYDHDDYPSSRSNDSNDGGNKREIVYNSLVVSEEKKHAEDEKGEAVVSNIRTCEVKGSDKDRKDHEMNDDVKAKRTEDSGAVDSLSHYDLESILRQKALENLRMFRRGRQTDPKITVAQKDVIGTEVNTPSSSKSELSQKISLKGVGDRVIGANQVAERSIISADLSQNDEKISNRNDNSEESGSAKHDCEHPPGQLAVAGKPNERVSVTVSSESDELQLGESSGSCTTKKLIPALQETPQAKSMTGNPVDKGKEKNAQTANPPSGNADHKENNNVLASDDPSHTKSPSGGTGSNKPQDEANEGSQFQQKTMSVMRGGEMVEVSYKVYIPKKPPALARRPLKR